MDFDGRIHSGSALLQYGSAVVGQRGADRWIEAPIEMQTLLPSKDSSWMIVEPLGDGPLGDGGGLPVGL